MKNIENAKELARVMTKIGELAHKETKCIITDMNQPVGYAVGNILEVIEAIDILKGKYLPDDIKNIITELGGNMLALAGKTTSIEEGKIKILENLRNGKGYEKFVKLVQNQGGDISFVENTSKFIKAKYILPIVIGILISVIVFGKIVIFLLNEYNSLTRCAFLGIIIGGIPTLIGVANRKGFQKKYLISMGVALIITILLTTVANNVKAGDTVEYLSNTELVIYGAIYSFGAVMPGMTTIHILIFMGVLPTIMSGIYALDLSIIIPFAVGYIIIALTTANLITYLFKKFYGMTYYQIISIMKAM